MSRGLVHKVYKVEKSVKSRHWIDLFVPVKLFTNSFEKY